MALERVGLGAVFLAPKRRFMLLMWIVYLVLVEGWGIEYELRVLPVCLSKEVAGSAKIRNWRALPRSAISITRKINSPSRGRAYDPYR